MINHSTRFIILVQLVLLLALSARAAVVERAARVRVAAESIAQGDRLTLGDIADISANDTGVANRLRGVALGYSPNVGAVRELKREQIQLSIAAAGFAADSFTLEAADVVAVKRASQRVAPELLREAVERVTLAGLQSSGATARLVRLDLPQRIEIPSGAVEASASTGGVRDLLAPFIISIELRVDGRIVRRLSATAQVEAEAAVLVAAHDLKERTRLRAEDVRVEKRRLERAAKLYVCDVESLRGAAISRSIAAGEPVTTAAIYAEVVVKPGDAVRIVGESGSLNVSVAGEARAAGRIGDRVQVKNLQSGVLLQAVVVDEGLVRVRF